MLVVLWPCQQQGQVFVLVLAHCASDAVAMMLVVVMMMCVHPSLTSFSPLVVPAPASLPLPRAHDDHAVDVQAVLRALVAQQPGVVGEQVVMVVVAQVVVELVRVVVEGTPEVGAVVCMSSSCLAAAAGGRVVVVVREDALHLVVCGGQACLEESECVCSVSVLLLLAHTQGFVVATRSIPSGAFLLL